MNELTQNRRLGWLMVARVTIEAAAAFFITASLLDRGLACSAIGRRFAEFQLIPSAMLLTLPVLAFWLAVTLIFGRVYCSTVCPLGALVDLGARLRSPRRVFRYHKALNGLRLAVFLASLVLMLSAGAFALQWVDPYGLYATIARSLTSGRASLAAIMAAAITGIIAAMAYRRGRLFCNSLCPLSAPLGFVARKAAFHIDINTDRCIQCRKCADVCKAECIDLNDHVADMSRCVVCFNCLPVCPNEAISYTTGRHALSTPLMQHIKTFNTDKPTSTSLACNNTSNCSKTYSRTETSKPTAPARER